MRVLLLSLIAAAVVAACASTPATDAEFSPRYHSWERIMEHVMDPTWQRHFEPATKVPVDEVDLDDVAGRAELAVRYLQHAMWIDPHADLAGFAEAEAAASGWLAEIATTARSGDARAVQSLIRDGEARYCDRCHDLLP